MEFIRQLLSFRSGKAEGFETDLSPDSSFVAVGDIHGRYDLLHALHKQLCEKAPNKPIVFLGDYVDRGPQSAEVLRYLNKMSAESVVEVVCLKGNHEAMMLDFLDNPENTGARWLMNGGRQTLASFGIEQTKAPFSELRDQLIKNAGEELLEWLRQRPLLWQSGNVVASHAGGDPTRKLNPRRGHGLLWGHAKTRNTPRKDGLWMVHGHYIVERPSTRQGRIEIDTGAWRTGRLTAAIIAPNQVHFLST